MTTIAWDGKTLAGDRRVCIADKVAASMCKVYKRKDGALIGISGVAGTASAYVRWFLAGEKGKAPSLLSVTPNQASDVIIVRKGKLEWYDHDGWHYIDNEQFAMGSGATAARAAMRCGKTAEEAVKIASEFDPFTSYETDTVTHGNST